MLNFVANTRRFAGAMAASLLIAGLAHAGIEIEAGNTRVSASSLTFSVSQQPAYDPETYMPVEPKRMQLFTGALYVSRGFDASSVTILKHVVDGTTLPTVRVTMTQDGKPGRQVWDLTNATFNNYSTYVGEGDAIVENFEIGYKTARLSVYTDAGNTPTASVNWTSAE
ncbi:hypothetical protein [Hyphomonas sp.]|uniref:hypothetical protein n=1 Tax=Hyphomonas sp. TaxID=87 RepID=UPI00391D561A